MFSIMASVMNATSQINLGIPRVSQFVDLIGVA